MKNHAMGQCPAWDRSGAAEALQQNDFRAMMFRSAPTFMKQVKGMANGMEGMEGIPGTEWHALWPIA
jgi:hypothetical protein